MRSARKSRRLASATPWESGTSDLKSAFRENRSKRVDNEKYATPTGRTPKTGFGLTSPTLSKQVQDQTLPLNGFHNYPYTQQFKGIRDSAVATRPAERVT